jgi:hypothetical protein
MPAILSVSVVSRGAELVFSRGDRVFVRYDISESEEDARYRGKCGVVRDICDDDEYGVVLDDADEGEEVIFGAHEIVPAQRIHADEKPMYLHDCGECIYLGQVSHLGERHDLYYCPKGAGDEDPALLVRHSGRLNDHIAGTPHEAYFNPLFAFAYVRAHERGLDLRGA